VQLNIKQYLKQYNNNLTLSFQSTVVYANNTANDYVSNFNHELPQVCPVSAEHGECHLNFIRKAQFAYSWDWGPTFATVGIAGNAYLEYFNSTSIYRVSPMITKVR
jgi:beta-mannosidase